MNAYTHCFTEEARKAMTIFEHCFKDDAQKVITAFDEEDNMIDGAEMLTLQKTSFECLKQAARDNPDALQTLAKVDMCLYKGLATELTSLENALEDLATGLTSLDNALDALSQSNGHNDTLSHSSIVVNKAIGVPEQATAQSSLLSVLLGVAICIWVINAVLVTFTISKVRNLHKARRSQEKKEYEQGEEEFDEGEKEREEGEFEEEEKELAEVETK